MNTTTIRNSFIDLDKNSVDTQLVIDGCFIVIEGLDGSGTTTQVELLHKWLEESSYPVIATREPSTGLWGSRIRTVLSGEAELSPLALCFAFMADRLDHLSSLHRKTIHGNDKFTVVSDRYAMSYLAYQQRDSAVPYEWLFDTLQGIPSPQITIFLDVSPEICFERMKNNRVTTERYEDIDILIDVNKRYKMIINILQKKGHKIVILDGTKSVQDIQNSIQTVVKHFL